MTSSSTNSNSDSQTLLKQRVLFFGEAVTLSHIARPMVLAQGLKERGHDAIIACDPRFDHLFENYDIERIALDSITTNTFLSAANKGKPLFDFQTLSRYIDDDLKIIEQVNPDIIVGDVRHSLAVSTKLQALNRSIPYLSITNAYWSPYASVNFHMPPGNLTRMLGQAIADRIFDLARPFVFKAHAKHLNRLRKRHGLPPIGKNLHDVHTFADHTLYADVPDMFSMKTRPSNHHFIGPINWSPNIQLPIWWNDLPNDKPIAYVTCGSSGSEQQLIEIANALEKAPVTVMIATAKRCDPKLLPKQAFIADYLPGDQAASRADVVICNGGSPTTHQALSQGCPVIACPENLDQMLNMQGITRTGAGISLDATFAGRLSSTTAKAKAIANATMKVINDTTFRQKAQAVQDVFEQFDPVDQLERVIASCISPANFTSTEQLASSISSSQTNARASV
jgi:UDP:flavonoid glycosyltransferase YjiC (YdhE family)